MERILLAYDGGEPARRALETAAELALAFHASLSVVSVVPLDRDGRPVEPWDGGEAHARELHEAKRLLADHGLEVDLLEPLGDPAPIVVGSRGLQALDRMVGGSIPEHVVTHTSATVVVTH
jgi:nucleotide-binding universal stress UspA family protein